MENIEVIEEFKFLVKIGYSKKKLRRIAATANLLLFLSTMIISLLNGLVAFIGFRYIFLADEVIAFLGTYTMAGVQIISTGLIFLLIYLFSYRKNKVLLDL